MTRFPAVVVALSALAASEALAQTALPAPAVELHGYHGSPFSDRALRLDGTGVLPAYRVHLGFELDYARRPLVADATIGGAPLEAAVVRHGIGASLSAAVGVFDRLELALQLPAMVRQSGDAIPGVAPPTSAGLEALRAGAKVRVLGDGWSGFGLGAAALASIPLGGPGGLLREDGIGADGRLFADWRGPRVTVGLGAGYRLRPATRLYDLPLDDELHASAAIALRAGASTTVLGEVAGATAAKDPFRSARQSPLEALLGIRQRVGLLVIQAAAGPGLIEGYGTPSFRAVLSLMWTNGPADRRENRVSEPRPPVAMPVPAPRPGDDDKEAAPDATAADPRTTDGDGDGVVDADDGCPTDPEDKDGFADADGCPDPDNDDDRIADGIDKCPNEAEVYNAVDDEDGCPDEGRIQLKKDAVETLQPVFFDTDRARVRHAFYRTLDDIAALLKAHPEIGRCAVEGHTDTRGPKEWNQKLSLERARAVVRYLVGKGVDETRLTAIGQGDALPWASNATEEGRAANRRVIFHIEGVDPEAAKRQIEIQKSRIKR